MDINATYEFNAPIEKVWDLLMDTNAIGQCLPGCRALRPLGNDRYEAELGVAIAAIAGQFTGTVAIEDKVAPHAYTLVIEGSGRQGFIKGRAQVRLAAEAGRTRVSIASHADAGGMIARVGQRLIEGMGRTMMDKFFSCLAARLPP